MAWTEPIVGIGAPIGPLDPTDSYASHLANYGRGGHQTAASTVARDAIPDARLEVGMIVTVTDTMTSYTLTSIDPSVWTPVANTGTVGTDGGRW